MITTLMREIVAETLAVVLVVIPITYLSVVFVELVPKTLPLRNPVKIVLSGAKWLFIADRIFSPLVTALEWSTKTILKVFFKRGKIPEFAEQTSIEIDTFSPVHQKFMLNMAEIEKKKVKDILLPWAQVVFVKATDSVEEIVQTILTSGHTRLPVKNDGRVLGLLHSKEFMALKESGGGELAGDHSARYFCSTYRLCFWSHANSSRETQSHDNSSNPQW